MRVIEVSRFGGAEVLRVADRPEPEAQPGRTRVAVTAATLNPADAVTRDGGFAHYLPDLQPPFVLGWDVAGTVVDGDGFAPGTRVTGMIPWFELGGAIGALADVVSLEPAWLTSIPAELDDATAATIPLNLSLIHI